MIHCDTNFLIQATKAGSEAHRKFREWSAATEAFGISTIDWAEYFCGPLDREGEAIARGMFAAPEFFQRLTLNWPQHFSIRRAAGHDLWPIA